MKYSLYIFAAFLVFASCSSPNETHFSGVLLPLAAGNSWQYETHTINSKTRKDFVGSDSAFVTFSMNSKGEQYWFYNFPFTGGSSPTIMRNGEWGLYQIDEQLDTEILPFQFPVSNGDRYDVLNQPFFEFHPPETVFVPSNHEVLTTSTGTYSCIHYVMRGISELSPEPNSWLGDFYFTPNVGLVKLVKPSTVTDSVGNFVRIDTLVALLKSYQLNY